MNARRMGTAVAAVSVLTLGLAACGGGDDSSSGDGDTIKIGIKFDQPGLGLKEGAKYTGLDVDVATYVAGKLGYAADKIEFVQSPSAQRETLIKTGQVQLVVATYSINDKRKAEVSFAGPYFIAGQDLLVRSEDSSITGPDSLKGKTLCSVTNSTSAQNVKDKVPGVNLSELGTYSECMAALVSSTKAVDALTTDDVILAGYAAQPAYKGKVKVIGKTFSTENYGIGLKKGDKALCEKVTTAINDMIKDGSWQKAVDANLGPANYKPGAGNPPTPAACA